MTATSIKKYCGGSVIYFRMLFKMLFKVSSAATYSTSFYTFGYSRFGSLHLNSSPDANAIKLGWQHNCDYKHLCALNRERPQVE